MSILSVVFAITSFENEEDLEKLLAHAKHARKIVGCSPRQFHGSIETPHPLWNSVLDHLRTADLEKIKAQFPDYLHPNLFKSIQVSVDALDEQARDRYVALAVMPEEVAIAPLVQQCLWRVDENEAAEIAEQLVSRSLAQRERPEGSVRLHDLQLDYVRAQYPDKKALELICGAVRLSSNVIAKDPGQFASQIVGRLLPYRNMAAIAEFSKRTAEGAHSSWLRSTQPTLHPPGTGLLRTLSGLCLAKTSYTRRMNDLRKTGRGSPESAR